MFISQHDLTALVVVLIAAASVAIVGAFMLGGRIGRASRALVENARRIGDDHGVPSDPLRPHAPAELLDLETELAAARKRLDDARAPSRSVGNVAA